MVNLEDSVQITGIRMFLRPRKFESSQQIIYADCSGDSQRNLKISEPLITRVLLRTSSLDKSRERKINSVKEEKLGEFLRPEPKSIAYHDPLNACKFEMELEALSCRIPQRPNFLRESNNLLLTNLTPNKNGKNCIRSFDEVSDTTSSFNTSSESLNFNSMSDMSSLVLSNIETAHLSQTTNKFKNMRNSTIKETNKSLEINSHLSSGAFKVYKSKAPNLRTKHFNNLKNVFTQEKLYSAENPYCSSLDKNISGGKRKTMTDIVVESAAWNALNGNIYPHDQAIQNSKVETTERVHKAIAKSVSGKKEELMTDLMVTSASWKDLNGYSSLYGQVSQSLKNEAPERVLKALDESASFEKRDTKTDLQVQTAAWNSLNGKSVVLDQTPQILKNGVPKRVHEVLAEPVSGIHDVEFSNSSQSHLSLKSTDFATEIITAQTSPNQQAVYPVDSVIVQNKSVAKAYSETCVQNKGSMEEKSINSETFNKVSRIGSNMSSQTSSINGPQRSKSIIFCPSSQSVPEDFEDTQIKLCDDCYQKTKKTLSDIPLNYGSEFPIANDKVDDPCKERFTQAPEKQSSEFNNDKEYQANKLPSHGLTNVNIEDLDGRLKKVNNQEIDLEHDDKDFLKDAMKHLSEKWIRMISDKKSELEAVKSYLKYVKQSSAKLLEMMMFSTDREDNNAFHFACGNDRFDIAEELLNYKCGYALLTQKNKLGHSPLMICSVSQPKSDLDWKVVKKMLDLGDVNETSRFTRQTPLMNAASRGCVQMVQLLLDAGADPNLQDSDGSTALMYAAVHGHGICVDLLLDHVKCNSRIKDFDQKTACSVAVAAGYKEIALQIYLHSRKRSKGTKNNLMTNQLQQNIHQQEGESKIQVYPISRSQSDYHS